MANKKEGFAGDVSNVGRVKSLPSTRAHDLIVKMRYIELAGRAYGTSLGQERWNPHCDITGLTPLVPDGKVDMRDIGLMAINFGKKWM